MFPLPDCRGLRADVSAHLQSPSLIDSPAARALLVALAGFIQPILHAYIPTSDLPSSPLNLENGKEAQDLILSLQNYIVKASKPSTPNQSHTSSEEAIETSIGTNPTVQKSPTSMTSVPKYIRSQELPPLVLEGARRIVFNKMPIRLLAFEPTGSHIQLLERNEILNLILSRVIVEFHYPPRALIRRQEKIDDAQGEVSDGDSSNYDSDDSDVEDSRWTEMLNFVEDTSRYAILSHTWIRDSPGDLIFSNWERRESNQRGLSKVTKFCQIAAQVHGVTFGWMDTVCINKDSSSELDESIRSMYKWYCLAYVCVAYLAETRELDSMHTDPWFTRGWTLQELLAPANVRFYNMDWEPFNMSSTGDVVKQIEKATTITWIEKAEPAAIPLSRQMQLAMNRKVTREEDEVYSLMGLLGVEISIAYGEGAQRALTRLMREVLSSTKHALDIFNHGYTFSDRLIPSSIKDYANRSSVFDNAEGKLSQWKPLEPIIFTHLGVRIPLLLVPALRCEQESISEANYVPRGDFSGIVELEGRHTSSFPSKYNLLDENIYKERSDTVSPVASHKPIVIELSPFPSIVILGVLNFGADSDNNDILLPRDCLTVPLQNGTDFRLSPSDDVTFIRVPGPIICQLKSVGKKYRIAKEDVERHGMQLVTLYL
ncbi:hypothetical protein HYPSUDRAFT_190915 [Hypholoma sublateritium FD-334 SS-4]|uniref:Heterokaryon incompatibility domain-containing protein n=1 Tax=Hypholoma sublateritium (strain FD-334 SS-4) TaxID=945553 RepID=A0A0D2NNV6_HYPSF|nr:hypothetical protein HYPSUDRAFT_190915 [Hypholoma sublateritium FD-334 SS-4]